MELIIVLAFAAGIIWWFFFRKPAVDVVNTEQPKVETPEQPRQENKLDPVALALDLEPMVIRTRNTLDVNQDGKVNLEDVKEVVKKTRTRAKKAADVDGDGKVTVKDAKAAVKRATKAKPAKKVATARKTRSKKA
jgi:hypothetical protein